MAARSSSLLEAIDGSSSLIRATTSQHLDGERERGGEREPSHIYMARPHARGVHDPALLLAALGRVGCCVNSLVHLAAVAALEDFEKVQCFVQPSRPLLLIALVCVLRAPALHLQQQREEADAERISTSGSVSPSTAPPLPP